MDELIGKKILGLSISEGEYCLSFATDQGPVTYQTDGDCCSETWFADIIGVSALIGGTVSEVDEAVPDGYNVDDERGRQESDQVYGYKIRTDKGYADIVFRNSSNGYYGGSIDLTAKLPDGMTPITDDWHA